MKGDRFPLRSCPGHSEMPLLDHVPIPCCGAERGTGCALQPPIGVANRPITFLEYRQLQDRFIGRPCHVERTKKDFCVVEPTLRQLEEHFIFYEMERFERYVVPCLPNQRIDYVAYLMGEMADIRSDTNRHFAWTTLGREPTEEELAQHYITSRAHENYRARFWHLVRD